MSTDIGEVFLKNELISDAANMVEEYIKSEKITLNAPKAVDTKLRALAKMQAQGRDAAKLQKQWKELERVRNELVKSVANGWLDEEFVNNFMRTVFKLLSKVTGREYAIPEGALRAATADKTSSPKDEYLSPEFLAARASWERLEGIELSMLNNLSGKSEDFFTKKRKVLVSTGLIPDCQRALIEEINEISGKAFKQGWTNDLIEIRPLSYIQNLSSSDDTDVVVLLEESELKLYRGGEAKLVFKRQGDGPVLINGLVAAGRAFLYENMGILRSLLIELSGGREIDLPDAATLAELLKSDRDEFFRRLPVIELPPIKILSTEIEKFNRAILQIIRSA